MKNFILTNSLNFITRYNDYSDSDIEKLEYGLEGIYLTVTKLLIIVIVSLLLNIFVEVLIILLFFNIIRFFGFGIHARKSYECLISSLILFVGIPLLFMNISLSEEVTFFICLACIFSYLLFAPADTVKRPLPNKKKRIIRKYLTVLTGVIYTILIFIMDSYFVPLLLSSLVIQSIVVSPLTYVLFRQPYNNYKTYIKA